MKKVGMSGSDLILLLISKEQTIMTVPWEALIQSKKYFCCIDVKRAIIWKAANENICTVSFSTKTVHFAS